MAEVALPGTLHEDFVMVSYGDAKRPAARPRRFVATLNGSRSAGRIDGESARGGER